MDFPSAEQGKRIKALRRKTHLSRRAFAVKHGIPKGSLQNWEDGRYQVLSKAAVDVLLRAFAAEHIRCTAEFLLYGTPIPSKLQAEEHLSPYSTLGSSSSLIEQTLVHAKQRQLDEKLLLAVCTGRNEEVIKLLKKSAPLRENTGEFYFYSEDQNSLLHEAAKTGHLNVIKSLIEHSSQANAKNKFDQTPLHLAIRHGFEEIAHYLILSGANLNLPDKEGDTPLAWACKSGQTAIARQLIKLGAELNSKNKLGYSPIHWAAFSGFEDTVKLLLENGAISSEKNTLGKTPLMCALQNGHVAVVELLEKV